ncbi:PA14 domain-containing protein [Butyricicoccus porcorum]|uniref:PA14 domain-containing protein n=1 Tax=Butyricicoccus porcorum TaxID=1945634 RepID=A0A252F267_9FIRM|nr:hypothetical protein [Butyricicoccus porcorum]OUM19877.1 hypothetical protein CBW42_10360 [Butyricicoccus porcorum]
MKTKFAKRVFSSMLTLGVLLSLLPTAAFAEKVTSSPGNTDLEVEYFNSTLYDWNEAKANAATANADTNSNGGFEGKGFYFTDTSSGKPNSDADIPAFSKWIIQKDSDGKQAQNYYIYSGLAASKLSESSNAPFSNNVNAANLFSSQNNDYTNVYTNVKVPFIYDKETGYYELNSDKNGVYFENGTGASDTKMQIADLPAGYTGYSGYQNKKVTGFAPFNSLSSTSGDAYSTAGLASTTKAYPINKANNANGQGSQNKNIKYGFGMVTTVDFQMTDTGKDANGKDITFEFAGDDDVWVYIDGVLALDIGGTHDAITGSINFATGDVILSSPYGKVGDKTTDKNMSKCNSLSSTLSQTNLYGALGTTRTGFAAQGNHTLTIYYMDRGQGRTNCLIKFNLPQRDSVSVTKDIGEYYLDEQHKTSEDKIPSEVMANLSNIDFSFTLYHEGKAVADKSYSLYDSDGNFVSTGSTDANGGFTLKNGQTATFRNISLDEESSWYIKENLSTGTNTRWEAEWTASSSVTGAKTEDVTLGEGETGVPSQKVTVTGSSSTTDTINFVCTNSYQRGPDPDVDIYDDTIVLDYGLPVEVDVMANDVVTNYGEVITDEDAISLTIPDITKDSDLYANYTGTSSNGVFTGTYGTAEVKDGKIVYTLTRDFCGIEKVPYSVTATVTVKDGDGNDVSRSTTVTGTLTVIPATSVYYEESFGTLVTTKTNNAKFESVGTSLIGYQETGLVGTTTDSTYGADAVYMNNLGDSYGTSLKADTTNGAAQYSYTFTGTGTTIYGRVSNKTGYIRVTVTDSEGKEVDKQYIDTINYVTVPDSETEQILDTTLYNIPIYQNTGLQSGYDTYKVTIYVYKSGTLHDTNNEFYLDGIRVYQPMGTSTKDNEGYATANSAYSTDGEQNVAVVNIREKIVADADKGYADDVFTLTDVNGNIMNVKDYSDIGPNQELYLKEGYSASFALVNWDSKSYKLYLGLKAPNGEASEVTVGSGTFEIGNSADCYYDISDYVEVETLEDGTVIGYVNIEGASGLTALTNLKVTGVDEFNLAYSTDLDEDNEGDIVTDDEDTENTLYLVSKTYAAGLAEEAVEEVPVFTPGSITTSCSYASKSKKATVNVVTSKDVAYVTINGVKVTGKNVSGKLRFTLSYKKVEAGTTWDIVAYNADGVASEHYTATAQ